MTCVHWLKTRCAPKNSPSFTRHGFILCCTRHWALPHRLSLLLLPCCCRPPLRTQTCCPRIQLSTAKIHSRMALLRNTTPPHYKHSQRPETWCCLNVWTWRPHKTVDWNSIKQAALRLFCIAPCRQKHWQMGWNSTVLFRWETTREVTEACTHKRLSAAISGISSGRPDVIIWWNPARWNRCVTTVNKLKALISTSAFQESHNSRQTTRTRRRFHKFKYLYKFADENRFVSLQTKITMMAGVPRSTNAIRVTSVKRLDTPMAYVGRHSSCKWRSQGAMNCFKILETSAFVFQCCETQGLNNW